MRTVRRCFVHFYDYDSITALEVSQEYLVDGNVCGDFSRVNIHESICGTPLGGKFSAIEISH
jgi:hypothetical protein